MESLFQSLLEKIDSVSDKIPESLYIEMCSDLKDLHAMVVKSTGVVNAEIDTTAPIQPENGYWLRQSQRRVEPVYANSCNQVDSVSQAP